MKKIFIVLLVVAVLFFWIHYWGGNELLGSIFPKAEMPDMVKLGTSIGSALGKAAGNLLNDLLDITKDNFFDGTFPTMPTNPDASDPTESTGEVSTEGTDGDAVNNQTDLNWDAYNPFI